METQIKNLEDIARLIRYYILTSTTRAGSGHPTSSMSVADLMTVLFFAGFYKYDFNNPDFVNNDRLIFSKGHASPLFYALYAVAGAIKEDELMSLRKFGSRLEGHPTLAFPYTEAATGSLGQGLSIGIGMALNAKYVDKLPYKTYVLLGDSEMAEGSVWEAIQIAYHYKLDNLVAVLDVNRLGQRGETQYGHDVDAYAKRVSSFGWEVKTIDGHNLKEILNTFEWAGKVRGKPVMIIAKTLKGKGVSFIEDKDNWHGKALKSEDLEKALIELGEVDKNLRGKLAFPQKVKNQKLKVKSTNYQLSTTNYQLNDMVSTRKAYGNALARIYKQFPEMVVLDAEVSNSTFSEIFKAEYPDKFFEMYIAEQNMVGTALGFSRRGKIPFTSTFAAFFSRAFDQIRMCQYSDGNVKFAGSHVGVSIGEDGSSQMGLEDIAMFRTLMDSVVFYPSDAVSSEKLVEQAALHHGNVYIRTTRGDTPVIYKNDEEFPIGGSKVLRKSSNDQVAVVSAGITLHEGLKAYEELKKSGVNIRVIDVYSVKPIDKKTLLKAAKETKAIITVEDHYPEGGIGEAVKDALSESGAKVYSLAVTKMPRSGKSAELLNYEEIDSGAIMKKVKDILKK